jgi:hypothetical protein
VAAGELLLDPGGRVSRLSGMGGRKARLHDGPAPVQPCPGGWEMARRRPDPQGSAR